MNEASKLVPVRFLKPFDTRGQGHFNPGEIAGFTPELAAEIVEERGLGVYVNKPEEKPVEGVKTEVKAPAAKTGK